MPCKVYQEQLPQKQGKKPRQPVSTWSKRFVISPFLKEIQNLDLKSNLYSWASFSQLIIHLPILGALIINFPPVGGVQPQAGSSWPLLPRPFQALPWLCAGSAPTST
jgi:hypothetical protein